jgi:hypothetical protein
MAYRIKPDDRAWGLDHAASEQKVIDGEVVTDHAFRWVMRSNDIRSRIRLALCDAKGESFAQRKIILDFVVTVRGPAPAHHYEVNASKEITLWDWLHKPTVEQGRK